MGLVSLTDTSDSAKAGLMSSDVGRVVLSTMLSL